MKNKRVELKRARISPVEEEPIADGSFGRSSRVGRHGRAGGFPALASVLLLLLLLSLSPSGHAQNATYTVCNRSVDERLDANNPTMKFGCGFLKYVVHYHWSDRGANPRLRVKAESLGGSAHGMNQGSVSYHDASQFDVPEFRTGSATISKWAYYVGEYSHSAEQGSGYYVGTVQWACTCNCSSTATAAGKPSTPSTS